MNHPAAMPLALLGRVEDALFKDASDRLTERLMEGGRVGRCDLHDLLDCDLDSQETYQIALAKMYEILKSEWPDTPLFQERYKLDLIQRYLDSHPDLVHDEMNAMEERDGD